MIVEITSLTPRLTFIYAAIAAHSPPTNIAMMKIARICNTGGRTIIAPKYAANSDPKRSCPSTPMLNNPARKVSAIAIAAM